MYSWIGKVTKNVTLLCKIGRLCRYLPRPLLFMSLSLTGFIVYSCLRSVRQQILLRMRELLNKRNIFSISTVCRDYFRNLIITLYEIIIDYQFLEDSKRWRFKVEGEHFLHEALQHGRGAIVFSPHIGNFFYYYWYLSKKYPCLTVATAGSKELRPLYLSFEQLGCRGLDYDATPPVKLIKTLREHVEGGGVLFLLGDFFRPSFPAATFFGRPTRSPGGATVLALEKQVPIVPFYGYRERGFKHRLVFHPPLFLYEELKPGQRREAMDRLNGVLEEMIHQVPGQWFYWFNTDERWEKKGTDGLSLAEQE
ncbi:lysophospholipid acyltransferase family protein [Aneurinibacillus sp. UBA3580]|uniref:lysophospholipid acyltransferase family protein n=1 Tax=Aneurinibacillus sp. UBA3580 TaxID=1946041 RepID=UPI00257C9BEB|nr:lysophospholipid acyltransferase family protein [Aneurinibacillus sp. UBA3580]